jgi:hypothetical protein
MLPYPGWGLMLASTPALSSLVLSMSAWVWKEMQSLRYLHTLTSLTLTSGLHDNMAATLALITSLTALHVRVPPHEDLRPCLQPLVALINLREFSLSDTRVRTSASQHEQDVIALAALPVLESVQFSFLPLSFPAVRALVRNPTITNLNFKYCDIDSKSTLALLADSQSLAHLRLVFNADDIIPTDAFLSCLQKNAQLLTIDLVTSSAFRIPPPLLSRFCARLAWRNRRLLHNWQCICVLLASYRANAHSAIRDSMLSLVHDVMSFLVPDDVDLVSASRLRAEQSQATRDAVARLYDTEELYDIIGFRFRRVGDC